MHLMYVIDSLAASGGAEQSLAMLGTFWVRQGYTLDVVVLHDRPGLQPQLERAGAHVSVLSGPAPKRVIRLRALIRERRPDLVHTTLFDADMTGRLAARWAGVPFVSSLVNTSYGPEEYANPAVANWKLHAVRMADTATILGASGVHAVSHHVAATSARRLRVPARKLTVIPRARDVAVLGEPSPERRLAVRRRLGLDADLPVLLIAARQEYQKGIDVAIEALGHVRQDRAVMLIAGRDGLATTALRDLARQSRAHDRIHFLGSRDDVPDLLVAADVCVVPSRREGMPGTVLEAMYLGTRLVVSDIPPNREALGDPPAGRVVPLDPQLFAEQIDAALGDHAGHLEAAARARFLDTFSLDSVGRQMMAFHTRATSR